MNDGFATTWDDTPVLLPERSRLYRLAPIGLGTALVESAASYIHRLAAAHGLPTWVLVRHELAPRFRRPSVALPNGHCDLFGPMGATINGNNPTAAEMASILEALTGQGGLINLTFKPWAWGLSTGRLIRRHQAWCPGCLEEWRAQGTVIYQPLIWSLENLQTCPAHECALEHQCRACGRSHTPLGRHHWNGRCPKCRAWLGGAVAAPAGLSEWQRFSAQETLFFMAAVSRPAVPPPESCFAANVAGVVETLFKGNRSAFVRVAGFHQRTVSAWTNGSQHPSLSSLMMLAYRFNPSPIEWLTKPRLAESCQIIRKVDLREIRPKLTRHSGETLRATLEEATRSTVEPPLSLAAVCRQIGAHQSYAAKRFPDLSKAICARFRTYNSIRKQVTDNFQKVITVSAVNQLLVEGRSLSYNQMAKVLPPSVSLRGRIAREEFKRYRSEVEQELQRVFGPAAGL